MRAHVILPAWNRRYGTRVQATASASPIALPAAARRRRSCGFPAHRSGTLRCPGAWHRGAHASRAWRLIDQFVFIDFRGMGMSDRRVDDLSLEALVSDLSAVVDQLELERFDLHAIWALRFCGNRLRRAKPGTHRAPRAAQRVPERPVRERRQLSRPALRALQLLLESDWDMYTMALAQLAYGWAPDARDIAALFRESTTQEFALAFLNAMSRIDVTDLLPRVARLHL